ncbi:YciI family protein [Kribbella sp. NPDC002412]
MKYVILIHSNPQPWGHPTVDYTEVGRAIPAEERKQMYEEFDALLAELQASGEFLSAAALDAPASSTVYRWQGKRPVSTDGPYAESKEQLAGFFLFEFATPERAEEVATQFAGPGDTVELRPVMM